MLGAYVCLAMITQLNLPFWVGFLLAMAFSVVLALALERLVLRPLIGEPVISIIMATIGLAAVFKSATAAIWGTQIRVFPALSPRNRCASARW